MKLPNADERVLSSLHSLKLNEDFQVVREYLEQALADLRKRNDTAVEPDIYWNQGAAQALQSLFDKQDSALATLKKKR